MKDVFIDMEGKYGGLLFFSLIYINCMEDLEQCSRYSLKQFFNSTPCFAQEHVDNNCLDDLQVSTPSTNTLPSE